MLPSTRPDWGYALGMHWNFALNRQEALRGAVAGAQGVAVSGAAQTLFDAGGRRVLPAALQHALRATVENEATRVIAGHVGRRLFQTASIAGGAAESSIVRTAAVQTARAAGRQVLRGVGAAAGAGALIDGGWALVHVTRRRRAGEMTGRDAAVHVASEVLTGAVATAAGAAAAAALVALTGGVAAPALFAVGAAASLGAKAGLGAWLKTRGSGSEQPVQARAALDA